MSLEKAAQALAECKYADTYEVFTVMEGRGYRLVIGANYELVDPLNDEAQRQALLEWFKVDVRENLLAESERWVSTAILNKATEDNHCIVGKGKTRIEAENACLSEILK